VVKNGSIETTDSSEIKKYVDGKIETEKGERETEDDELRGRIGVLEETLKVLDTISGGNLVTLFDTINNLQAEVNTLKIENVELKNRIAVLEEWVNSQSEGGSGSTGGSSGGVGFGGEEVTDDGTYFMIVTDAYNKLYKTTDVVYDNNALKSQNGFYQE
jgi:hypothetical protein